MMAALPPKDATIEERRRAHARAVRLDLITLWRHRVTTGQDLDLFWLGFCLAVPTGMFPPGRYRYWPRVRRGPRKGEFLRAEYWGSWPVASAEAFAVDAGIELDDDQLETLRRGVTAAQRHASGRFLKADTMARRLNVTIEEREGLAIWKVGAIDAGPEERKARRIERRRARDRARDETRRRARGAKPRAESVERLKPWEAIGESRMTFYRRPKEERDRHVAELIARKAKENDTENSTPLTMSVVAEQSVSNSTGVTRPAARVVQKPSHSPRELPIMTLSAPSIPAPWVPIQCLPHLDIRFTSDSSECRDA
jgi:hypothetical protein